MRDFRELKVWEKAHRLTLQVYKITKKFRNFSISPGKSYFATIHWIPAFAGMTGAHTKSSFPRRRESNDCCPDLLKSYKISF